MNVTDFQYGIRGFDREHPDFVIPLQTPLTYEQAKRALRTYRATAGPNNSVELVCRPTGPWELVVIEPKTTVEWAQIMEEHGYTIDLHCSPLFAYTGPRFNPTSSYTYPKIPG